MSRILRLSILFLVIPLSRKLIHLTLMKYKDFQSFHWVGYYELDNYYTFSLSEWLSDRDN